MIPRSKYPKLLIFSAVLFAFVVVVSGCIGSIFANSGGQVTVGNSVLQPDNCTKCHQTWAEKYDYYHGWDRYGYVFDGVRISGFYDSWSHPDVENTYRTYYSTDWWETPELYPWPEDIAEKAESMSVLSRPGGIPEIPASINDINGPVITVAKEDGDFKRIQKAVNKAKAGTTVFVRPGEYNEVIILKDGVSLIGEDPYTTVINPLNQGHAITAANNSIIAGFTLTGTGIVYKTKEFHSAIYVTDCDSTCVIANNIFRENGLFGVWVNGTTNKKETRDLYDTYGERQIEVHDIPYENYPNPVIMGNTFYRIGQRGIFFVHARGEAFNNIFSGNVKAMGLERHSQPFIHHNVFYYNNIPMAVNRSEPIICNNIMYKNQWGQRMLRGANPVIFNNVTFESPHYRDFDEDGRPLKYNVNPGTGEREMDPLFDNPLEGTFKYSANSRLRNNTTGFGAVGIMRDDGIPQPLIVEVKDSYGREVLSMNEDIVELIGKIDRENAKIRTVRASYKITYEDYMDVTVDSRNDPRGFKTTSGENPVRTIEYNVPEWTMNGSRRDKRYSEVVSVNGTSKEDSGRILYNGSYLEATGGQFAGLYNSAPDKNFIGEKPFREAPGGFYRDYDQFIKGAFGAIGTNYNGLLRIMGGIIGEKPENIDGHDCIAVRYPHIGKDQYMMFYLDPNAGYRPRKMEQYCNEVLYRVMDSYTYKSFAGGIYLPLGVTVTDYVVSGPEAGKKAATWELAVDENSLRVNR
ncbi:nitrous oxide reductase family maturation protein NosD [Candidatus Latescibacterota bacterium]